MRRRRFTATLPNGDRRVILAYTPAEVARHYGVALSAVQAGDYRRMADSAGWKLDQAAIAEAQRMLGLNWPVDIKVTNRAGGCVGSHQLRYDGATITGNRIYGLDSATGAYHRIVVKGWRSAEEASRTLWHELTHAMQAERAAREAGAVTPREIHKAWAGVAARNAGIAYSRKPIEVEAREGEQWHDALALVTA